MYDSSTRVSLEHMLCFHPCPGWTSHHGTSTPTFPLHPHIAPPHQGHFALCAERSGCPSVFIFFEACCASGCCVCTRVCFLLSLVAYLLSAHCVLGAVADFLWVCLLMPLLLLWGPLSVFSVPILLPLCQSGCLRFCVSLSLCRALFVSLPSLASDSARWPLWVSEDPWATLTPLPTPLKPPP